MRRPLLSLSLLSLLALGLGGCSASRDLGTTCKMTRPNPVDGQPPIELDATKVSNPGLDYISFGAAECDDLVCVRTAGSSGNPANENGMARGYCSAPCIDDSDCSPDYRGKNGTLVCRQVLPDLTALAQQNPQQYQQTFGGGASAKYCILPRQ